ncbi:MAG: hypothetical protein CMJ19_12160 [Phycisphaeraceae bacterium]|nr:hypothetical protein [Phycisphaeraceae bacterium]
MYNRTLLMVVYSVLLICSVVLFFVGINLRPAEGEPILLGIGALAMIFTAATFPIAYALTPAKGKQDASSDKAYAESLQQVIGVLRSINDRMMISDTAKRIAFRERDQETLRQVIRTEINRGNMETALSLAEEMSKTPGYEHEGQDIQRQIIAARADKMDRKVLEAISIFEQMLSRHEWDDALTEARQLQQTYPDSARVKNLAARVREARESHKKDLERQFLEAARRDDVETAMDLLKELDHYMTEKEAAPLLEVARGVIGKKRQNLGVQFKLAVADHEWIDALHVGEQIIADFPNTKMADEVLSMMDLLKERAAGQQQAARNYGGI